MRYRTIELASDALIFSQAHSLGIFSRRASIIAHNNLLVILLDPSAMELRSRPSTDRRSFFLQAGAQKEG